MNRRRSAMACLLATLACGSPPRARESLPSAPPTAELPGAEASEAAPVEEPITATAPEPSAHARWLASLGEGASVFAVTDPPTEGSSGTLTLQLPDALLTLTFTGRYDAFERGEVDQFDLRRFEEARAGINALNAALASGLDPSRAGIYVHDGRRAMCLGNGPLTCFALPDVVAGVTTTDASLGTTWLYGQREPGEPPGYLELRLADGSLVGFDAWLEGEALVVRLRGARAEERDPFAQPTWFRYPRGGAPDTRATASAPRRATTRLERLVLPVESSLGRARVQQLALEGGATLFEIVTHSLGGEPDHTLCLDSPGEQRRCTAFYTRDCVELLRAITLPAGTTGSPPVHAATYEESSDRGIGRKLLFLAVENGHLVNEGLSYASIMRTHGGYESGEWNLDASYYELSVRGPRCIVYRRVATWGGRICMDDDCGFRSFRRSHHVEACVHSYVPPESVFASRPCQAKWRDAVCAP